MQTYLNGEVIRIQEKVSMAWMSPLQWGTAMRNSEDTVPEVTGMPTVESVVDLERT